MRAGLVLALAVPAIASAAPHSISYDLAPIGVTYSIASDPPPEGFLGIFQNLPFTGTLEFDTSRGQRTAFGYENLIGITVSFGDLVYAAHIPEGQYGAMRVSEIGGLQLEAELVDPSLPERIARFPGQNVTADVIGPTYLGLTPKIVSFNVDLGPELRTTFPSITTLAGAQALFSVGFQTPRGNFVTFDGRVLPPPVPEPATVALWLAGLPLLLAWARSQGSQRGARPRVRVG